MPPAEDTAVDAASTAEAPVELQGGPQQVRQRVMTQVVGGKLRPPAGPHPGLGTGHDRGIGDQDVQGVAPAPEPVRERPDGGELGEVGEIDLVDHDLLHAGQCLPRPLGPTGRDHDPSSGAHERAGGREPQAGIHARDDRRPPGEIDPGENVVKGAGRA